MTGRDRATLRREHYAFRERLVGALARDLVGPADPWEPEEIDDAPITSYVSGVLYPRDDASINVSAPETDVDTVAEDDRTASADPPVAMANVRYPSSMGLTFAVDPSRTGEIRVATRAARYEPVEVEHERSTVNGSTGTARRRWVRRPLDPPMVVLDVSQAATTRHPLADGLELYARVRVPDASGTVAVTLALVNTRTAEQRGRRDELALFQTGITIEGDDEPFVERRRVSNAGDDADLRSYSLLYRHAAEFAVGHGCSVTWDVGSNPARAVRVGTTHTPEHELLLADSNPDIDSPALGMRTLAHGDRGDVLRDLDGFCAAYRDWIADRRGEVDTLPSELRGIADDHLAACEEAADRMLGGVRHLGESVTSWTAFRLANEAMLHQRARTDWLREGQAGRPRLDDRQRWRPFQLAFVLLCLESVANERSPHRDLADLLWFPTGGGKTEAYLGLIALAVLRRRLAAGPGGGGVTALMRYTLRLLTAQQFERATLLICCLEEIRRRRDDLGDDEIAIGLWIGGGGTPNSLDAARTALNKLRRGESVEEGSPVQIGACPWCGTPLDANDYTILRTPVRRMVITCRREDCAFREGLPVHVVDEDVYRAAPSLLIATADKFASMPWKDRTASLFNLDRPDRRPPELIIQDELHLISGPLGTLAGLYETAVDVLCTHEGARPKVVASTATIRRADRQALGLFDREVRQFPPPALDSRDSYFAVEAPADDKASRLYVGVMAPGTSQTTLLVRVYGALLQRVAEFDADDEVRDPYWTLVGYFNSLRVLGGAVLQVQDDVQDRIALLAKGSGVNARAVEYLELTSRVPASRIRPHLDQMAVAHPDENAVDVILATNMISTGVDVDRLGLMVVMGQPQATAEYIQATSRVGRRHPGLVVTLLNAGKSRDRSHYESFVAYHSALYRQVESTSVTPFSPRARDRALHALVVALARLLIPALRPNDAAARVGDHLDRLDGIRDMIIRRAGRVDVVEVGPTESDFDRIVDRWASLASREPDLVYWDMNDPQRGLLADAATQEDRAPDAFGTLWSLRDVDTTSNLYLVRL